VNRLERPATQLPDDADDLRGFYFRLLLRKASTQAAIAAGAILVAVAGLAVAGPAAGSLAFIGGLLVALAIVFAIADSRSEKAFFEIYGEQRKLAVYDRSRLPETTPLLRKGDDRYAERTLEGPLGDGVDGLLALYTYEEQSTDSDGNRQTDYHHYTVGIAEVPECARFVPELYCQRKFGPRALEGLEDVFRSSKERLELESEALAKRYEIFAGSGQDANWLRQLFSPTFIVWLSEAPPEKFAFELVGGNLCCYVRGHEKTAAQLDIIRACTAKVATRLREEAQE
jgi:hypothetical protein